MGNYQTQQELFRLIKKQLLAVQIKSLTAVTIGLTALIATPLIAKNTLTLKDRILNASGFIIGLTSFSYALVLTKPLRVLSGKNRMIEELEKNLLIEEQVSIYNEFKKGYLQPAIDVSPNTSINTYSPPIKSVEVAEVNTSETSANSTLTEDETLNQVILALENNKSDTYIIENILGYKGRNFSKGKEILEAYKALLRG